MHTNPSNLSTTLSHVAMVALDPNMLRGATGYLVADVRGRVVGRVESATGPDRLTVRSCFPARRRRIVPADAIDEIDATSRVIALRIEREALRVDG